MRTTENAVSRGQYRMKRLGTEKFRDTFHVALVWVKGELARGYSPKEICTRPGGGDTCKWYGVSYGSYGGPGHGKVEAKLYGHPPKIFKIKDLVDIAVSNQKQLL